jgi:hypothetical protein
MKDCTIDVRESLKRSDLSDSQFDILLCVNETLKISAMAPQLCKDRLDDL